MSWPWNLASLFSCCRTTCARWNSVVTLSSKGWRDLSRVPANQISLCITFIKCDFLVPVGGMSVCSGSSSLGQYVVVVVLEGLENAHSVTELLGDLCEGLENRGTAYLLHVRQPSIHPQPRPRQPLATRGDRRPSPNPSSPSQAAGDSSHEPAEAAAVPPHHEHPLRPLTATQPKLNQAAVAKQGRPQPDKTTTSTKTTNTTRKSGSYTETCMTTTTIRGNLDPTPRPA